MTTPTREEICLFVKDSVTNRQYNSELIFELSDKSIERIKKKLPFNMLGFCCVISSHSIRHIKKGHPKDLEYICEILNILENFFKVEKSLTKCTKTGGTLVSLEFYKKFDNGIVKLVKLKVNREKRLELKTLFIKQ
jgi:hypothetical protein